MTTQNITSIDGSSYKAIDYLKMFSMPCRKIITVDNKKRMNITNFTNIYTNI